MNMLLKILQCPLPSHGVLFRKVMQTISLADKPVLRYSEVIAVAEACSVPISAIPSVLNFYHELGVFLYYSNIPSLQEVVIATPQWLVDHIAKLLAPRGLEDHGRERQWSLFRQSGILTKILYTEVLKDSVIEPQGVLDLLEYFLLAIPIETTCIHPYIGKEYFIPCMLDTGSDSIPCHSSETPSQPSAVVHTAKPMHLIFNTHYVPPGFYIRLLASIAKCEDCNIVFEQSSRYAVTFDYQEVDEIAVREHTDSIEVQVTRALQGGPHVPPFHRVCRNILELMNNSIQEVDKWLPSVAVNTAFICSCCSSDLPRHFVTFDQDVLTTTTVRCRKKKRQQLGQLQSQEYWLNIQETLFDSQDSRPTNSQMRHSGTELTPQQQCWGELPVIHPPPGVYTDGEWIDTLASKKGVRKRKATAFPETTSQLEPENYQEYTTQGTTKTPRASSGTTGEFTSSQEMTNWEYQTMSRNSSAITSALANNSLANILADELRSRKLIGAAVHAKATSYGPDITEYWRVKQIITSMLSKIEHNPQRYYDFIDVLQLDRISGDAEAALALLPAGPPQEHQ